MDQNLTVCMISCLHNLQDDRIYWKEALSLQKAGYSVTHIGVGDGKEDEVTREGIRLIRIRRKRYFKIDLIDKIFRKIFSRNRLTNDLLRAAKKIPAAVYHFHDLQINKIGSRLKALPQKPKVIYDVHESYADLIRDHSPSYLKPFNYFYALYIEKWEMQSAKFYDAIVTTEEYVLQKFKRKSPLQLCEIIYNFSYFQPGKAEVEKYNKEYDAIYSGSISRVRGIYEIVATVELLQQYKPSIKILVIGSFTSNRLKEDILQLIKRKQLTNNLIVHDAVPFETMDHFYLSSRIGLCIFHPIKIYKNAVFIKTFEYMAFGLPVIGSNFGTVAHYIEKTNTGITVDPLNPSAIANAILYLLNHPDTHETYSINGIASVKNEYNWEREQEKLIALYNSLLCMPQ